MYSEIKEILELDSMKKEGSALDRSLDTSSYKLNVKDQLCNTHVKEPQQSTEVFMIDDQIFDPELDIPEEFDISFDPSCSNQSDNFDIEELLGIKKPITNDSTLVKNYSLRGTVVKSSDIESSTHDATNIKQDHTPFLSKHPLGMGKHLVTSNQDETQVLGVNMSIYEHDKISGHNTKHHNTFSKIEDTKDCSKISEKTKTIVDTEGLPTKVRDDNVLNESLCSLKQVSKSFSSLKKPSGHGTFNSSPVRSYQLEQMKASLLSYNNEDCQTQMTQEEDSSTSGVVSDSLQSSVCTNEDINDSGSSSTSQLSVASNKSSEVSINKKITKPVNRNSKLQMQKSKSLLPSKPVTGRLSKPTCMKKQSLVSKPVSKTTNVLPPPSNKERVVLPPPSNKERVVLPSSNKERVVLPPPSNKERVVLPSSNKERVVLSPSNKKRVFLPSSNKERVVLSPSNRERVVLSPSNKKRVVLPSSNKERVVLSPSNKERVVLPSSNKERVVLPPSNKERVVIPSSNKERVVLPPSNKERVVLPPSNKERVVLSPSNRERVVLSPSNKKRVVLSPSNKERVVLPSSNKERVVLPPSNKERVVIPSSNKERVVIPSLNKERVVLPPSNKERVVLPPSNKERVVLSPSNRERVVLSPSNKKRVVLPSSNKERVVLSPSNKERVVLPSSNKERVVLPPSNKERVVIPSSNKERVVIPSSNKERVVLPPSNKERVVLPPSNKERVVSRLPSRQGSFRQKQTLPVAQTKTNVSNLSKPSMIKEPTKNLPQSSKYGLNPRPTSQDGIRKPVINKTTQLTQKPMKSFMNKTSNSSDSTDPNFTDTTTSLSPTKIHSTPKSKDQISVAHTTPHRPVCKSTPINAHLSFSSMEHVSSSPLEKALKKENEGETRGVTHSGRKRRSLIPTPSTNEPVHKGILTPIPINLDDGETRMRTTIDPIKKPSVAPPRILGPLKKPKGNLKPQLKTRKTETRSGPLRPKRSITTSHDYDPEYEMKLLKRTENSQPKVMHSPIDKENRPATPHSEWSPIKRKKIVDMQDPCFQCTKYYIGMKQQ